MLPVSFTFLAIVAKVRAEKFTNPVQVNLVLGQSDQGRNYIWHDDTGYSEEGPRRGSSAQGTDEDAIAGYLTFLGPDDKRAFTLRLLSPDAQ